MDYFVVLANSIHRRRRNRNGEVAEEVVGALFDGCPLWPSYSASEMGQHQFGEQQSKIDEKRWREEEVEAVDQERLAQKALRRRRRRWADDDVVDGLKGENGKGFGTI
jgi:hypothetical protein